MVGKLKEFLILISFFFFIRFPFKGRTGFRFRVPFHNASYGIFALVDVPLIVVILILFFYILLCFVGQSGLVATGFEWWMQGFFNVSLFLLVITDFLHCGSFEWDL